MAGLRLRGAEPRPCVCDPPEVVSGRGAVVRVAHEILVMSESPYRDAGTLGAGQSRTVGRDDRALS
jgi:hypothetical protein